MKTSLNAVLTLLIFLTSTTVFSQKLTREEVNSKLTKSWTAIETGNPDEELSPKNNKEIMDFKPDGSLIIQQYSSMMGNSKSEVLWGFEEDKQKLVMTLPMGGVYESQELDILELSDDRLVLMSAEKQTVYIPSKNATSEASFTSVENTNEVDTNDELNPGAWSGKLPYNIIIMYDANDNQSEERVPGLITLEKLGEKKIIRKKELGNTITWTVNSTSYIANITRYEVVCSDLNLNGEITFQNGFMLLEVYEPKYMSYLWAVE